MSRNQPKADGDKHHVREYRSTEPPHKVIRRERCDCAAGQARGVCSGGYESPSS